MKKNNRISDAEWQVMRVIWDQPGLAASEVLNALSSSSNWSQNTVNTFLVRLEKKGIISSKKLGRIKHYEAIASELKCQRAEGEFFLKKVFKGKVGPALLHFVKNEQLSEDEIAKLHNEIDKLSKASGHE